MYFIFACLIRVSVDVIGWHVGLVRVPFAKHKDITIQFLTENRKGIFFWVRGIGVLGSGLDIPLF
jgi:hypothetical protein